MSTQLAPFVLAAVLLAAAGVAAVSPESAAPGPSGGSNASVLPPNHPPIGDSQHPHATSAPANDEEGAIAWQVPADWETAPNPSSMRIGTYMVKAGSRGASSPAEVSVVRAGGTTEANIQRWLGQFDDAGQETRTTKTVRGLKITIVEVFGTFLGGSMTPSAKSVPRPGWALLGAIVETTGTPYFFKMTGDAATVRAARASFDALVDSVTPS